MLSIIMEDKILITETRERVLAIDVLRRKAIIKWNGAGHITRNVSQRDGRMIWDQKSTEAGTLKSHIYQKFDLEELRNVRQKSVKISYQQFTVNNASSFCGIVEKSCFVFMRK